MKKKRTEYNIHKDFDKWKNFNPPLSNRVVLSFFQGLLGMVSLKVKSDDTITVDTYEILYDKNKKMKCFMFSPKVLKENAPCLMYMHGGGYVLPGAPHHYNNCKKYAVGASCKVLYVDYPLSPKNKYPVAVNACFEAYKWLLENADKLSIDKNRIIVGGDSAGGNLSTTTCMKAFDNKVQMPLAEMLIYPGINSGIETESMKKFTDTPLCNSKDCEKYRKYYLEKDEDKYGKYISPLNAEKFSIFPPSYVETAEFDCLRDEAKIFAQKLIDAKVEVEVNNTKQTMHGYDIVEDSEITLKHMQKRIDFLKKHFYKNCKQK